MLRRSCRSFRIVNSLIRTPSFSLPECRSKRLARYASRLTIFNYEKRLDEINEFITLGEAFNFDAFLISTLSTGVPLNRLLICALNVAFKLPAEDAVNIARQAANRFPAEEKWATFCRSIMFSAVSCTSSEASRVANMFIVKTALGSGIRFLRQSHVVKASNRVRELAEEGDTEAMALYAQILVEERGPFEARQYFEKVYQNYVDGKWKEPKRYETSLVVNTTEFKVKYAHFVLEYGERESGITEAEAYKIITHAGMEEGHYEACLEVVREETKKKNFGVAYHTCLVRMALTGDFDAANRLGDLYSLPQAEWDKVDEVVRREVEDHHKVSIYGSIPPEPYYGSTLPFFESPLKMKKRVAWSYFSLGAHSLACNEIKYYQQTGSTVKGRTRYFKALDWYNYASVGGHKSAPASGFFLACRFKLPMESFLFSEQARWIGAREIKTSEAGRRFRAFWNRDQKNAQFLIDLASQGGTMWHQLLRSRNIASSWVTKKEDVKTNDKVDEMLLKRRTMDCGGDVYQRILPVPSGPDIERMIQSIKASVR
jgi:hypothetical protein